MQTKEGGSKQASKMHDSLTGTTSKIVIKNARIIEFYEANKSIDIEYVNLLFIDIIEKLKADTTGNSINTNIGTQLLQHVASLESQLGNVYSAVTKIQTDTNTYFTMKLADIKKEYIDELKMQLSNNSNLEKITAFIKENNGILQDKLFVLLNTEIPKNNTILKSLISDQLLLLQRIINEDTNKLLSTTLDKTALDNFVYVLEGKMASTIANSQGIINNMVTSSESRLDKSIMQLKDSAIRKLSHVNEVGENVSQILRRLDNKEMVRKAEGLMINVLNPLYPSAEIQYVEKDIMMKREGKPTILFENTNYETEGNVATAEVSKFLSTCEEYDCCGIMMSKLNGIANKTNFQIDINGGNMFIYLHNVNNDTETIRLAVDVLDNMKTTYDKLFSSGENVSIEKQTLEVINSEYSKFVTNKQNLSRTIRDMHSKLTLQLDEIKMPSLEVFLGERYTVSSSNIICEICGFTAKNLRSLKSHQRGIDCKNKKNGEKVGVLNFS